MKPKKNGHKKINKSAPTPTQNPNPPLYIWGPVLLPVDNGIVTLDTSLPEFPEDIWNGIYLILNGTTPVSIDVLNMMKLPDNLSEGNYVYSAWIKKDEGEWNKYQKSFVYPFN